MNSKYNLKFINEYKNIKRIFKHKTPISNYTKHITIEIDNFVQHNNLYYKKLNEPYTIPNSVIYIKCSMFYGNCVRDTSFTNNIKIIKYNKFAKFNKNKIIKYDFDIGKKTTHLHNLHTTKYRLDAKCKKNNKFLLNITATKIIILIDTKIIKHIKCLLQIIKYVKAIHFSNFKITATTHKCVKQIIIPPTIYSAIIQMYHQIFNLHNCYVYKLFIMSLRMKYTTPKKLYTAYQLQIIKICNICKLFLNVNTYITSNVYGFSYSEPIKISINYLDYANYINNVFNKNKTIQ